MLARAAQHARVPIIRRCGLPTASATRPIVFAAGAPREVQTAEEANELMAAGYKYVDVRRPDEFAAGHAPGAVNFSVQDEKFVQAVTEAFPDKEAKLMVACQVGGRSTMAAGQLADKYPNLVNFKGSFNAWTAANMPVEK